MKESPECPRIVPTWKYKGIKRLRKCFPGPLRDCSYAEIQGYQTAHTAFNVVIGIVPTRKYKGIKLELVTTYLELWIVPTRKYKGIKQFVIQRKYKNIKQRLLFFNTQLKI